MTRSLAGALFQLRYTNKHPILWADAVCINQEDKEEKCKQVKIMDHIYSHASQVLIWLGLEADDSHEAFEWIRNAELRQLKQLNLIQKSLERRRPVLASRYRPAETLEKWQQLSVVDAGLNKAMREFKKKCISSALVVESMKLLKNSYFTRAWII